MNPIMGKRAPGSGYAPGTVVHSETVLRAFYDFHLECGTGPLANPVPTGGRPSGGGSVLMPIAIHWSHGGTRGWAATVRGCPAGFRG